MVKQKCLIALILLCSVWVIPLQLKAQSPDQWWLHGSRTDSVKKELLFHAGVKYSYSRMKGSISGVTHLGDITLVERKGVFTNFSAYGIDKRDMNLGGTQNTAYKTTSQYFTDYIDADLSKVIFGQAGFIWERDDILLLQNRYSIYTGMGINILLFKKLKLKSLVAMGRINQDYTIPVDNLDVVKEPFIAFYCKHNVVFTITKSVTFLGQVYYYTDIQAKGRYRYGSNLNLQVNVAKHFNLVVGYNFKYDREQILFDSPPGNSTQTIGIEVIL